MKKKFGIYAVIWAVALVVFNVVSFTVALNTGKELNASFFIGYGAVTAAFIGQLLCAYCCLPRKTQKVGNDGISRN